MKAAKRTVRQCSWESYQYQSQDVRSPIAKSTEKAYLWVLRIDWTKGLLSVDKNMLVPSYTLQPGEKVLTVWRLENIAYMAPWGTYIIMYSTWYGVWQQLRKHTNLPIIPATSVLEIYSEDTYTLAIWNTHAQGYSLWHHLNFRIPGTSSSSKR